MSTTALRTISATILAGTAEDAIERATRVLAKIEGFELTGRVSLRSERHLLWDVEIGDHGGDVNDAWVWLTSFGMSPADDLGSVWQTVPGVGR